MDYDIDLVPLYCDYVYTMDQGEIILPGPPIEVRDPRVTEKWKDRLNQK